MQRKSRWRIFLITIKLIQSELISTSNIQRQYPTPISNANIQLVKDWIKLGQMYYKAGQTTGAPEEKKS
jgi:hypothetical protein